MSYDTDQVLERAAAWRAEGRKIAIATVVRTWGSSPRPPGSKLAVNDRGEFVGSVSGGCIEPAVMHEARAVMAGAGPKVLEFGVSNEAAWEVGLACGGRVQIYVEAPQAELLERLLRDVRAQRPAVLVTWLASGEQSLSHPDETPPLAGDPPPSRPGAPPPSAPAGAPASAAGSAEAPASVEGPDEALASAEWLTEASASNEWPASPQASAEWPAGAALEAELDDAARRALAADESLVVASGARGEALVEPFNPPLRLLVVGAVHIAQPLAKMATEAGFSVVVIDPRKAFASEERFGGVRCVRAWPDEALASLAPDRRTAVVTLTHDPKLDDPALEAALRSPAFFVGCLGSQKTHRARLERLGARGFGGAELARLHGPVGLRIGAKTPAEIAVSVLAQIVERLRAGSP